VVSQNKRFAGFSNEAANVEESMKELAKKFKEHGIHYCIVGGNALRVHGYKINFFASPDSEDIYGTPKTSMCS
jgi:hypothetical protein